VIIDTSELESPGPANQRNASGRTEELRTQLARGTREQVVARPPVAAAVQIPRPRDLGGDPAAVPIPRPRDLERRSREDQDDRRERGAGALERDPIAVLRAWPHTSASRPELPPARPSSAPPAASRRRVQDKIVLAHLALDLYQEIDQLQAIVQRAHDASPAGGEVGTCSDPRCAATTDVLRGALIEACLLVQRVAMMAPAERLDVEDRIHELLELLQLSRPD